MRPEFPATCRADLALSHHGSRRTRRAAVSVITLFIFTCSFSKSSTTLQAAVPRIPGFERFHRQTRDSKTDSPQLVSGGRLLIGELGCSACHRADAALLRSAGIVQRQAPVLTGIGSRVTAEFLREYLSNPQRQKPGAVMPDVLAGLPENARQQHLEALVHFLASTGSIVQTQPARGAVNTGEQLFHQVGCVACHNPRQAESPTLVTSVPLGTPHKKYSVSSLTAFLKAPHTVRPSGRMPGLNLKDDEARNLASYLMHGVEAHPNVRYKLYRGNWSELPDFTQFDPATSGMASGFDLAVANATNNFGLVFRGFLHIPRTGSYRFHLGSDDGSRLLIDDESVVDMDGIHPYQRSSGQVDLQQGIHAIEVQYFQGGGEWVLTVDFEGPGLERQPVTGFVTATPDVPSAREQFQIDHELVKQGRRLFVSTGCANCHELEVDDSQLTAAVGARPLVELRSQAGCLAQTVTSERTAPDSAPVPRYELDSEQSAAILALLQTLSGSAPAADTLKASYDLPTHYMKTFNCYACHSRNSTGGVERERDVYFQGTIPEMGDEGRIPPLLDGVGDKLTADWFGHVLNDGANDRPYMLTRMPKFGMDHIGPLVAAITRADLRAETEPVEFRQPLHRIKAAGRLMVGDQALSCVKCHTFAGKGGTGIQSLDLTTMTRRLRQSWFQRYMLDPQAYRPGTRMPLAWPNGRSVVPAILDGDPDEQVAAIWTYLKDGSQAQPPTGLGGQRIELVPEASPIIYRNFLKGLSPRGIAVGYPEKAHLAFDAEKMCLTLIWHGAFIDAGKHWIGRGPGDQWPLGDHVFDLGHDTPFAIRKSAREPWPQTSPREQGYQFLGYRLDEQRRPIFRYQFRGLAVEDHVVPVPGQRDAGFHRTIRISGDAPDGELWFRAATAEIIEVEQDDTFLIDRGVRIRHPNAESILVTDGDRTHLLIRVSLANGQAELSQTLEW